MPELPILLVECMQQPGQGDPKAQGPAQPILKSPSRSFQRGV
uniref:Uncharacterized protein n=1 Tax=Rhizophora mucronata TaxID=61149 RepID=A0A2P2LC04_RHIMU